MDSEQSLSHTLKHAWYGMFIGIIFTLLVGIFIGLEELGKFDPRLVPLLILSLIIGTAGMAFATYGFLQLGKHFKNTLFVIGATISLIVNIIVSLLFLSYYVIPSLELWYAKKEFLIVSVIVTGLLYIPYTIGMIQLKKDMGSMALWAGSIGLLASVCAALGYFIDEMVDFSTLLFLLTTIFEIMILYDVRKKFPIKS